MFKLWWVVGVKGIMESECECEVGGRCVVGVSVRNNGYGLWSIFLKMHLCGKNDFWLVVVEMWFYCMECECMSE